jgi:hypothetical protein
MPYKYKGSYNLNDFWILHYDAISSTELEINHIIRDSVHTRWLPLQQKFSEIQKTLTKREDIFDFNDLFARTLKSSITLNTNLKNKDIYFKKFKLQDYSEYKSERRNSIINNLLT